jgi:hypothetical protein
MNWIKCDWQKLLAMFFYVAVMLGLILFCCYAEHAHAQKPECDPTTAGGAAQMTGLNSSIQYKCSPEGKWVIDQEATAKANANTQKPEPKMDCVSYVAGHPVAVPCPPPPITQDEIGPYIESHCRALRDGHIKCGEPGK